MKHLFTFFLISLLFSCSVLRNNSNIDNEGSKNPQKVELYKIKVKTSNKVIDIKSIIVGEDYTYLSDLYSSKETKFYYNNQLFTGIGYIENENQITRIAFKNGIIDGLWYDRIIWNQNSTNEWIFVNGEKEGGW